MRSSNHTAERLDRDQPLGWSSSGPLIYFYSPALRALGLFQFRTHGVRRGPEAISFQKNRSMLHGYDKSSSGVRAR